ncbi:MAG: DNA-binding response OmpR family regulator/anti-sigma regulatory factor (Ser/Thr protein kinase) [Cellvibrionaceae bacterium]|jgi:DNA-binding response OmpR family regulator/anti-sigma regulatory factor (Ser/Thr protein kinase)
MAKNLKQLILIVEDDASLREGIHDLLELEEGADILSVSNGVEALDILTSITPNLIISDIMMPLMNGFELLEAVRKNSKLVRVPFIFLTARGTREEVFEGRKSGAEMYITKPFDPKELVELAKTQLQRATEKQLASQEDISSLKRSVLQILNHEFRTPLTYVTAYYDMLEETIAMQKEGQNLDEYLNGILSGCERLIDLIEDLILVMDVRSGILLKQYRDEARPIRSLSDLIASAIHTYQPLADKNNINIHFNFPQNINSVIWGIEDQLIVLLKHLVENAVKFTIYTARKSEGNVTINVSTSEQEGWVDIEITDTGIGIPESAKQKIFDLFYQHNRNYYEQQGSGSGLPIAQGIVDIHEGTLQIKNSDENGSCILLSLPTYLDEDPSRQLKQKQINKPLANLLLVEDDPDLLTSLEDLIHLYSSNYQFKTHSAINGKAALKILENFMPDLIISDVLMPELDGFGLLKAVRKQNNLLHVPFIIVSARNRQQDIFDGRVSGAEEYITKPYDIDEFMALVEVQLNRHFVHKQVANQDFDNFKQKILSMLQPDFRIPIQSVSQSSNLLSGEQELINTAEDLRYTLAEIQTGSQKISELVEDFMSLAEIETGEARKAFNSRAASCFDFGFLITEAISHHKEAFNHNNIKPNVITSSTKIGALIEYSSMQKALTRLIGIATAFCISSEGTEITIEVKQESSENLSIWVWHNGLNLSTDVANQIHEILHSKENELFNPMDFSSHIKIVNGFTHIHDGKFSFLRGKVHKDSAMHEPDRFVISLPKIDSDSRLDTNRSGFLFE